MPSTYEEISAVSNPCKVFIERFLASHDINEPPPEGLANTYRSACS
jgi:hypothetical protein